MPLDIVASIETEKANGTNFYSLVIGCSANYNAIKVFKNKKPGRKAWLIS